jgi:hypothetical protein
VTRLGLSNISSVFSRFFVVGFFLPPFFGLVLLWQTLAAPFPPNRLKYGDAVDVAVLGGVALVIALLLSAAHVPIRTLLEGDVDAQRLARVWPFGQLLEWLRGRERKRRQKTRDELAEAEQAVQTLEAGLGVIKGHTAEDSLGEDLRARLDEARRERTAATRVLYRQFPGEDEGVRPTRLGNTVRAWQSRVYKRWALDPYAIVPHVRQLLSEQERDRGADAETDVAFFVNSAIVAGLLAICYVADWIAYRWPYALWWLAAAYAAFQLYRFAVGAAARYGDEIGASIDLHRFDLYAKFGVRNPQTREAELALGDTINAIVLTHGEMRDIDRQG